MDRSTASALAVAIHATRPDWSVRATTDALSTLEGTAAAIMAHAAAVASNPENRSPVALTFTAVAEPDAEPSTGTGRPGNRRPCAVCGRGEWACERAQANTGLDPHTYQP